MMQSTGLVSRLLDQVDQFSVGSKVLSGHQSSVAEFVRAEPPDKTASGEHWYMCANQWRNQTFSFGRAGGEVSVEVVEQAELSLSKRGVMNLQGCQN